MPESKISCVSFWLVRFSKWKPTRNGRFNLETSLVYYEWGLHFLYIFYMRMHQLFLSVRVLCVCECVLSSFFSVYVCLPTSARVQVNEAVPCHSECSQFEWRMEPWSICTINTVDDLPACGEGVQSRKIRSVRPSGLAHTARGLALRHTQTP